MSLADKAKNSAQENVGKAKEKAGGAAGDKALEREGKKDRAKGGMKQAGEKVKDALGKD